MDIPLPRDQTHPHSDAGSHAHPNHYWKFMQVAMILAVLTGVEIVIIWLPFGFWSIFWPLFILSAAKFVYVIVYFMHLRWDKALCTILFLLGLVIAGLTAWALHALFGDNPYDPVADGRLPVSTEMVATA